VEKKRIYLLLISIGTHMLVATNLSRSDGTQTLLVCMQHSPIIHGFPFAASIASVDTQPLVIGVNTTLGCQLSGLEASLLLLVLEGEYYMPCVEMYKV
jgi:hypothetical protein